MSLTNSLVVTEQDRDVGALRASVERLAAKVSRAEVEYDELSGAMDGTVKALEGEFPAYSRLFSDAAMSLTQLRAQWEEVEAEEQRRREEEAARRREEEAATVDDLGEAIDEMTEGWRKMEERARNRKERRAGGPKGTIAQLFRRLANLCHPDKTQDAHLHELFAKGKEARDAGDRAYVADLLLEAELHIAGTDAEAGRKIPDLMERLLERRENLTSQLYTWQTRASALRRTPVGQLHAMVNHSSPSVQAEGKNAFKAQLLKRVGDLESEATRLRQRLLDRDLTPVA